MLLLPALLFLLLMTIFPTIYSLWLSLQQYNLSRPDLASFVGLRNYGQLLQDDLFWKSVRLTLTFSFIALALQLVDYVHVMSKGRVVYSGKPQDLWADPEVKSKYLGI